MAFVLKYNKLIWGAVLAILPFGVWDETASCHQIWILLCFSSTKLVGAGFVAEQNKNSKYPSQFDMIMWINERYICSSWLTSLKKEASPSPALSCPLGAKLWVWWLKLEQTFCNEVEGKSWGWWNNKLKGTWIPGNLCANLPVLDYLHFYQRSIYFSNVYATSIWEFLTLKDEVNPNWYYYILIWHI